MTRLRDFGFAPGILPPGPHNAITDVAGVRVGQSTRIEAEAVRTGITAVLPHGGPLLTQPVPAAVYTINGYGKPLGFVQVQELGRIETPIVLTNTLAVGRTADAVVTYMLRQAPRLRSVNPLVGECNDGYLNDSRSRPIGEAHVLAAIDGATDGPVTEGNVGAGTGTACYQFKGGIGTASRRIGAGYTVGALLQTNFGLRPDLMIGGVPVGAHLAATALPDTPPGSVMIVLATDAPLTARQLGRLARRAALGLARTGTICDSGSGDFAIAFSTQRDGGSFDLEDGPTINELFRAVVESVEEAIYNALVAAETMTGRNGHTLYALPHDALRDLLRRYGRI